MAPIETALAASHWMGGLNLGRPSVRSMEQEEVCDGDGIVARTADTLQHNGVAVDCHRRIAGSRCNPNVGAEIQGRYDRRIEPARTVRREVDQILIGEGTGAVGVEVRDHVMAEAVSEDEGIAATAARQSVVIGTADDNVVAPTTVEGVLASAAIKGVGAVQTG